MLLKAPITRVVFDEDNTPSVFVGVTEIETEKDFLRQLYSCLGCDIVQAVYPIIYGKEYVLFCDEEGKLKPWTPTLPLKLEDGSIYDIVANSYVLFRMDDNDDDQNYVPLKEEEIQALVEYMENGIKEASRFVREMKR